MTSRDDVCVIFCCHFCNREFRNRGKYEKHSGNCPKSLDMKKSNPILSNSESRFGTEKGINQYERIDSSMNKYVYDETLNFQQDFLSSRDFQVEYGKVEKIDNEIRLLKKEIYSSLANQIQSKKKKKKRSKSKENDSKRRRSKSISSLSSKITIPTSLFFSEEPKKGHVRKRMKQYTASSPKGRKRSFTSSRYSDIQPRVQSYHLKDSLEKFRLFEIEEMKKKKEKYFDSFVKSRIREEKYKKWKTVTFSKVELEIEKKNQEVERKKKEFEKMKEETRKWVRQEEIRKQKMERERIQRREKMFMHGEVRRMSGRLFQDVYELIVSHEKENLQKKKMFDKILKKQRMIDKKRQRIEYRRIQMEISRRRKVVEKVNRSMEIKVMRRLTRLKKREDLERMRLVSEIKRRKKQEKRIERKWIEIRRSRIDRDQKSEEEKEKKRVMERIYRTEVSKYVNDWFSGWEGKFVGKEEEKKGIDEKTVIRNARMILHNYKMVMENERKRTKLEQQRLKTEDLKRQKDRRKIELMEIQKFSRKSLFFEGERTKKSEEEEEEKERKILFHKHESEERISKEEYRLRMEKKKREEEYEIWKIQTEYESERKNLVERMRRMERKRKAQDKVMGGLREQMKGILGRVIEFQKSASEARLALTESEIQTIEYEMEKTRLLSRIEELERKVNWKKNNDHVLVFKCKIKRKDCFEEDRFILFGGNDYNKKKVFLDGYIMGDDEKGDPEEILELYLCSSKKDEEVEET